jgi:hypothetical protein
MKPPPGSLPESAPVADDFRVTIEFEDEGHVLHFGRLLSEREIERELRKRLAEGVIVTRDGPHVYLYAGTRQQAAAAERAARDALAEQDEGGRVSAVERWHPVEERWEDAEGALPQTDSQLEAEETRRQQAEIEEAQEEGYAEWEVRIDLASHRDAVSFAERLESEGIRPIVRRWKYILIGTPTEEGAEELAARLEGEAPPGATVRAEASAAVGWEITSNNPFSIFGGFGPGLR